MADEPTYETKTVRAVRGTEARSKEKWRKDGWELVDETPGKIQTELTFRRPKPKFAWKPIALGVGVLVIALIAINLFGGGDDDEPEAQPSPPATSETATPEPAETETASAEPSPTAESAVAETDVLTIDNSPDLAALLTGPADGDSVAAFATEYEGQVIQFEGAIAAMNTHGDYDTRYDILVSYGPYSETVSYGGPNFQFRDVNVVSDLGLTGSNVPDTIGVGTEVLVTATVVEFEPDPGLFLLEPIETEVR